MDFEQEVWIDLPHYENLYQISSYGRVLDLKTNLIVKQRGSKPYYYVRLMNAYGKRTVEYIHRIVALAFIPNPDNLPQVNHKDEDKGNNHVSNLEWCTASYNVSYSHKGRKKGPMKDSTKKKLSDIAKLRTGEKNSFYGKHHTQETKDSIAEKHKGKSLSDSHKEHIREGVKNYYARKH